MLFCQYLYLYVSFFLLHLFIFLFSHLLTFLPSHLLSFPLPSFLHHSSFYLFYTAVNSYKE